jgi:hypothetical protein
MLMSGDGAVGVRDFYLNGQGGFYFYPRKMAKRVPRHSIGSSRRTSIESPTTVRPYGCREPPFKSTLTRIRQVLDFISLLAWIHARTDICLKGLQRCLSPTLSAVVDLFWRFIAKKGESDLFPHFLSSVYTILLLMNLFYLLFFISRFQSR